MFQKNGPPFNACGCGTKVGTFFNARGCADKAWNIVLTEKKEKLGTLLTHAAVGHEQRVVVEPHGWFMWTNDFLGIYDNAVKQNLGVPPQVIPYKPTILGTPKKKPASLDQRKKQLFSLLTKKKKKNYSSS